MIVYCSYSAHQQSSRSLIRIIFFLSYLSCAIYVIVFSIIYPNHFHSTFFTFLRVYVCTIRALSLFVINSLATCPAHCHFLLSLSVGVYIFSLCFLVLWPINIYFCGIIRQITQMKTLGYFFIYINIHINLLKYSEIVIYYYTYVYMECD